MNKQQAGIIILWVSLLCWGCGDKEKPESFLPINTIIKSQLNELDTSLHTIIKVTYIDTSRSDTSYIRREEIRDLAKDFLTIPELSKKNFTEENIPGPTEGMSTLIYRPVRPNAEELKQVDLIIDPSPERNGSSPITAIIVNKFFSNKDSMVEKKLMWQMSKSFQVTTIKQLPGQPETYSSYKVMWSGVNDE